MLRPSSSRQTNVAYPLTTAVTVVVLASIKMVYLLPILV